MNKVIAAYVVVGMLTFGYSYNADYRAVVGPYTSVEEVNTIGALMSAIGWPLYWSVQAFRWAR